MIQNTKFWPFSTFSNLFPPKLSDMIQNVKVWLFCTFSNLLLPELSKMISTPQFWLFHIFCNVFAPKLFEMIKNAQFWQFLIFPNLFPLNLSKIIWNAQILAVLQFFQSFLIKVVQNNSEHLILATLHYFPIFLHQSGQKMRNYSTCGFKSEGWLPCWQLCHKPMTYLFCLYTNHSQAMIVVVFSVSVPVDKLTCKVSALISRHQARETSGGKITCSNQHKSEHVIGTRLGHLQML